MSGMAARSFTRHRGIAAPLPIANLNTDVIIRVARATLLPPDQLGPWALEALRFRPDGTPDPGFVLNRTPWDRASILVAGANFGCGSSRETAVWALWGFGMRCVVAPSFGAIFHDNCFENGMLPIRLPETEVAALQAEVAVAPEIEVDLVAQTIVTASRTLRFEIEPLRRRMLIEGLDAIGLTLRHAAAIAAFQGADAAARPWVREARRGAATAR